MNWLTELLTGNSIAHAVLIYAFVIATGVLLGKIKIGSVSLGVTFVLFMVNGEGNGFVIAGMTAMAFKIMEFILRFVN